jgi:5-oxoprolinase (ATP-hydrolysing)/N-methylhydantoinase A
VHFDGAGFVPTSVHRREALAPGARVPGPAIVEEREATTVVPPGTGLDVDELGNLVIERLG